ncbi:MAG: radical SAM protein [Muribaculaceae bacterium]|nr:radical SAM protein [Muribaculaceae bacterium]
MQTVMFSDTVFGPIHSRRLGSSLGINLSPRDGKICSFDCLYCEAGYNAQGPGTTGLPRRAEVVALLEQRLQQLRAEDHKLDVITFSGNGEPTLNPDFPGIIDDTLRLRDKYYPDVKVSVLTNSTMLHRPEVVDALRRVDNAILKLDSANDETIRDIDRPTSPGFTADKVIAQLADFGPKAIIQTMITRGSHEDRSIDNSTDAEVDALIEAYKTIRPRSIMIYSLDRPTPETRLQRVPREELDRIASRITAATSIPVSVA